MKDTMSTMLYVLGMSAAIVIFASLEQPYGLAAASVLLIVKQLGRINATLGGER